MMKSFGEFVSEKRSLLKEAEKSKNDWRKEYVKLEKGFVPPSNMKPVVQAFLDSGSISLTNDTSSKVTLPKKSLFLVGGPVRDFLMGKQPKDMDLATNATPEQIALILHSAGFKVPGGEGGADYDRSGKVGKEGQRFKEMKLSFTPEIAGNEDKKIWYLKGRDASQEGKPFVIGAVVNGEEFDIATFRKDAKTVNGQSEVDFVDNPNEDAARRDLTMNAMYIELNKADGENSKLYDPTKRGYHDIHSSRVRTVGKAEERFGEDKLRVMRAIRFHCKFGKNQPLDPEIKEAIPKFLDLEGVALERVREEFLKGLEDQEIDPKKYLSFYSSTGLIRKVFPGVLLNINVPTQLRDKKDKFLAIAWILQDNPIEKVEAVLSSSRMQSGKEVNTGWSNQEKGVIAYLLRLKEFDTDNLDELLNRKKILGITKDQIKKWVDLFDVVDGGSVRSARPNWSKRVRSFADFNPDPTKLVSWFARDDRGNPTQEVHPEIKMKNLAEVPPHFRGSVIKDINKKKLKQMFDDTEAA
jgi:tRNA nucleotidyltransferase/poly(A) polymerase